MDIKETAKNYFNNRLNVTLEDVETLFQDIYDEGRRDRSLIESSTKEEIKAKDFEVDSQTQKNTDTILTICEKSKINPQPHYDNSNGSLYKFAEDHKLNSYEFDICKRIVRARKKGQFKEDLQKTKDVIDIYLREFKACNCGENECCQNC